MIARVKSRNSSKIVEIPSNIAWTAMFWNPLLRSPSGGGEEIEAPGVAIVAGSNRLRAGIGLGSREI